MARYVIGDVQGCFDELQRLLTRIQFSPSRDHLYFVGDLVNRGPASLEVLRWAYQFKCSVSTVLGNHDLHLLACEAQCAQLKNGDTLDSILAAADRKELCTWLREQPLFLELDDCVIAHAGVHPAWGIEDAISLSDEVSQALRSPHYANFLSSMYGNKPDSWSESLTGMERLRFAINVFTRMRVLDRHGRLDFKFKGELQDIPSALMAWFDYPSQLSLGKPLIFGHWSALGLQINQQVCALDTGCVWGGCLTAYCLDTKQVFQVRANHHKSLHK